MTKTKTITFILILLMCAQYMPDIGVADDMLRPRSYLDKPGDKKVEWVDVTEDDIRLLDQPVTSEPTITMCRVLYGGIHYWATWCVKPRAVQNYIYRQAENVRALSDLDGVCHAKHFLRHPKYRLMILYEDLLTAYGAQTLEEKFVRKPGLKKSVEIALQIARTVSQMHQRKRYHLNIAPYTIFWTANNRIKLFHLELTISDLGEYYAREINRLGSKDYASPTRREIYPRLKDDTLPAADAYSIVAVLVFLLGNRVPTPTIELDTIAHHSHMGGSYVTFLHEKYELTKGLPAEVFRILERGSKEKYRNMNALIADLEAAQAALLKAVKPIAPDRDTMASSV